MSGIEKRGWEDELNAAWAEVNKARRELAGAVGALERIGALARNEHVGAIHALQNIARLADEALASPAPGRQP
jgi:hypothetical protein